LDGSGGAIRTGGNEEAFIIIKSIVILSGNSIVENNRNLLGFGEGRRGGAFLTTSSLGFRFLEDPFEDLELLDDDLDLLLLEVLENGEEDLEEPLE